MGPPAYNLFVKLGPPASDFPTPPGGNDRHVQLVLFSFCWPHARLQCQIVIGRRSTFDDPSHRLACSPAGKGNSNLEQSSFV
jgi:hypothetical protein